MKEDEGGLLLYKRNSEPAISRTYCHFLRSQQILNKKEGDTSVWDALGLSVSAALHQTIQSIVQFTLAGVNTVIASCFGCQPKQLPLAGLHMGPNKFWSCMFVI